MDRYKIESQQKAIMGFPAPIVSNFTPTSIFFFAKKSFVYFFNAEFIEK
jgi:hypothetical protein